MESRMLEKLQWLAGEGFISIGYGRGSVKNATPPGYAAFRVPTADVYDDEVAYWMPWDKSKVWVRVSESEFMFAFEGKLGWVNGVKTIEEV